jgi:hypothetical protein
MLGDKAGTPININNNRKAPNHDFWWRKSQQIESKSFEIA